MRRRSKWRVSGPYKHGRKWRLEFARGSGDAREVEYESFATQAAAEAALDGAKGIAQGQTVKSAVDQFIAEKRAAGRTESTIASYADRLGLLLRPVLSRPLQIVRTRGDELYRTATVGRAVDTHQHALEVGRMWGKWCVKRKLLRANPFADVESLGRRVLGADKIRLTVDESRVLEAWCLEHPADPACIITLAYLYLGSRASELTKRDVRDLDDNGRLLWIRVTKSKAGRRRLRIPPELTAMLLALVAGRKSDAPLFAHPDGSRWTRHLARRQVLRTCKAAGVPEVSPQALRRTQATLATEAGETALAVARHLGHATGAAPSVTGRSYVSPEASIDAKIEQGLQTLQERKKAKDPGSSLEAGPN